MYSFVLFLPVWKPIEFFLPLKLLDWAPIGFPISIYRVMITIDVLVRTIFTRLETNRVFSSPIPKTTRLGSNRVPNFYLSSDDNHRCTRSYYFYPFGNQSGFFLPRNTTRLGSNRVPNLCSQVLSNHILVLVQY